MVTYRAETEEHEKNAHNVQDYRCCATTFGDVFAIAGAADKAVRRVAAASGKGPQ